MQNAIQKFRQSSIVFEKPDILSENLKTLTSPNYPTVNIFCWNFAHVFYLPLSKKGFLGLFLFYVDLWVICKIIKRPGFYSLVFYTSIDNSRSKQNTTNPTLCFVNITK